MAGNFSAWSRETGNRGCPGCIFTGRFSARALEGVFLQRRKYGRTGPQADAPRPGLCPLDEGPHAHGDAVQDPGRHPAGEAGPQAGLEIQPAAVLVHWKSRRPDGGVLHPPGGGQAGPVWKPGRQHGGGPPGWGHRHLRSPAFREPGPVPAGLPGPHGPGAGDWRAL